MSKFKLVNRPGAKDTMLLIPGWATDYRIFDALDINYNYLLPVEFSPGIFCEDLLKTMKENGIEKVSVLGWSMGGYVACELAAKFRERVNEIIFVGARRRYEKANNENIKTLLARNRKAFLYKFYNDCVADDSESHKWFRENLLKYYLERMELGHLSETLDYISGHQIEPEHLEGMKVTFIHGRKDRIAPIGETMELMGVMPHARFIPIDGAGHLPLFAKDFGRLFI